MQENFLLTSVCMLVIIVFLMIGFIAGKQYKEHEKRQTHWLTVKNEKGVVVYQRVFSVDIENDNHHVLNLKRPEKY